MPVRWHQQDAGAVAELIRRFPPSSGWCRVLAARLLVYARRVDRGACVRKLVPEPSRGVFVAPLAFAPDPPWEHHFGVHVQDHVVDAFTGAEGTPSMHYLKEHWQYPEALRWVPAGEEELKNVDVEP